MYIHNDMYSNPKYSLSLATPRHSLAFYVAVSLSFFVLFFFLSFFVVVDFHLGGGGGGGVFFWFYLFYPFTLKNDVMCLLKYQVRVRKHIHMYTTIYKCTQKEVGMLYYINTQCFIHLILYTCFLYRTFKL